ncbi:MAG: HYR domain-containing protein [Saprospiraceae bacterium]
MPPLPGCKGRVERAVPLGAAQPGEGFFDGRFYGLGDGWGGALGLALRGGQQKKRGGEGEQLVHVQRFFEKTRRAITSRQASYNKEKVSRSDALQGGNDNFLTNFKMKMNHYHHLRHSLRAALLLFAALALQTPAFSVTKTWNGSASTSWNNPSNWTPFGVPEPTDDVIINSATIILDINPHVAGLTASFATLTGAGSLSVSGNVAFGGSSFLSAGGFTVGGNLSLNGSTFGNATPGGGISVVGATAFGGGTSAIRNRVLAMSGGGAWTGGSIIISNGGVLRVGAGATLTINYGTTQDIWDNFGGGGTLENMGTIEKNGSGITQVGVAFQNSGTLRGTGWFNFFANAFTNTGTIAPGFSPGTLTLLQSTTGIAVSTLNMEAEPNGSGGANVDLLSIGGSLTLTGATLNLTSTASFCAPTEFTIITYSGTRTGTFASLNLPANALVVYDDAGKKVKISLYDSELPSITCPPHLTFGTDPGECSANNPSIGTPAVSDNCPGSLPPGSNAPASFSVGTTAVLWVVEDAAGNAANCLQNVTVSDDESPAAICPPDVSVQVAPMSCTANASFSVTSTDNCGVAQTDFSHPSGSAFPVGITTVTVVATDDAGNSGDCQFNVVVAGLPEVCNGFDDDCDGSLNDEPLTPVLVSTTNSNCAGTSGAINISVSCGVPPYTFLWSNGASTEDLVGIPGGTYTVTVTDNQGVMQTLTATITQAGGFAVGFTSTRPGCFGGSDGKLRANPSGVSSQLMYAWSTGATTREITNIPAGTYTVTVTAASSGCTQAATGVVLNPPQLVANLTVTNTSCFGQADGSARASATGGTGSKTYSWSTGATGATLANLAPSTYTVTATDSKGCTATATATLVEPSEVVLSHTLELLPNGRYKITLSATGGTPYTTGLSHRYCRLSPTNACAFNSTTVYTNLLPGTTHIFRARDLRRCVDEITVALPTSLTRPAHERTGSPGADFTEKLMLALSPNPVADLAVLAVQAPLADDFLLAIHDAQGRLVHSERFAEQASFAKPLSLSALPSGVYVLTLTGAGESRSLKFVRL